VAYHVRRRSYHPPKPLYQSTALLDHIEAGVDALTTAYPAVTAVLAGDFNTLDDSVRITRCDALDRQPANTSSEYS